MSLLKKIFGDYSTKELKRIVPVRDKVLSLEDEYSKLTDAELQAKTPEFKERLANGETTETDELDFDADDFDLDSLNLD